MHMYTRGYILEQQSILLLFVTRIFSTSMFLSALSIAIFNTRPSTSQEHMKMVLVLVHSKQAGSRKKSKGLQALHLYDAVC